MVNDVSMNNNEIIDNNTNNNNDINFCLANIDIINNEIVDTHTNNNNDSIFCLANSDAHHCIDRQSVLEHDTNDYTITTHANLDEVQTQPQLIPNTNINNKATNDDTINIINSDNNNKNNYNDGVCLTDINIDNHNEYTNNLYTITTHENLDEVQIQT